MPATPNLASSGLVACWCFSVQVYRVIPTPLIQAKCANWMKADTLWLLTDATQAQYVAMVIAHTREFCLVDWALLPLSTKE